MPKKLEENGMLKRKKHNESKWDHHCKLKYVGNFGKCYWTNVCTEDSLVGQGEASSLQCF
jgi:hypothetical protein